jgi:hypothetical protein
VTRGRVRFSSSLRCWPWLNFALNVWQAGFEAQQVVSLRLALLAGNGPVGPEANRMVLEKISAAMEVQHAVAVAAMSGSAGLIPARTLAIYRRKIRANRQRLEATKTSTKGLPRHGIKGVPT